MATYHCSIKSGSKGSGASSTAKALYICREGKYADKPDLEYKESGNMPSWAQKTHRAFWKATDEHERANGRVFTEIEIALPRDYPLEERKKMVQRFIKETLGENHPYTVAIHNPKAALDGGEQPHAHIIFSERKLDGIERSKEQFFKRANAKEPEKGGTAKDRTWNDREKVQHIRESWERHHNKAVFDFDMVSCRSLKAQGIDREAEQHLGPKMAQPEAMEAGKIIEARSNWRKLEEINREIRDLSREIEEAKVDQVKADLAAKQKTTPQDIVAQPQPPKTGITPTAEPKIEKIQEINQTPDLTRRADPDRPGSSSRNTTSSELPIIQKSFVPPAQSDSVTPLPVKESNHPIQQPAVDSATLNKLHKISKNIARMTTEYNAGNTYKDFYDRNIKRLIDEIKEMIKNGLKGLSLNIGDKHPIKINGIPINEIVEKLPQAPKPTPKQGHSR
jgi:MobA/MobL family